MPVIFLAITYNKSPITGCRCDRNISQLAYKNTLNKECLRKFKNQKNIMEILCRMSLMVYNTSESDVVVTYFRSIDTKLFKLEFELFEFVLK